MRRRGRGFNDGRVLVLNTLPAREPAANVVAMVTSPFAAEVPVVAR